MKEINKSTLDKALANLPGYEPSLQIWAAIDDKLNEQPLQRAIKNLPDYQPDEKVWELIEKNPAMSGKSFKVNWYAAATVLLVSVFGFWLLRPASGPAVSVSQQEIDSRLQRQPQVVTDQQFLTLKAYCETETLVCGRPDFKQLTNEYETLRTAAQQLQQAIGDYNTEPDLMRQLSVLEREKAEILNKMAKMI